jgi:hypothetical protein
MANYKSISFVWYLVCHKTSECQNVSERMGVFINCLAEANYVRSQTCM